MSESEKWPPILTTRRKSTVSRRAVRAAVKKVIAERMAREQADRQARRAHAKGSSSK